MKTRRVSIPGARNTSSFESLLRKLLLTSGLMTGHGAGMISSALFRRRLSCLVPVSYFALALAGCRDSARVAPPDERISSVARAEDFIDHGTPVPVSRSRGTAAAADSRGNPIILSWLSGATDASLLVVDATTGESRQHPIEGRARGRFFLLSSAGQFYAYGDGKLLVYDVNRETLREVRGPGDFGYSLAEGNDGTIYVALNPRGNLLAYNPASGKLSDLGLMGEGATLQYPRQMAVDSSGWIYIGFVQNNHITAYHPPTGERRILCAATAGKPGKVRLFRGEDGAVYALAPFAGDGQKESWQRFLDGNAESLPGEPAVAPERVVAGAHEEVFRHFPDGTYLRSVEIDKVRPMAVIASSVEGGEERVIRFSYENRGALLISLAAGPDGRIYGSSGHPLYLFAYDPEKKEFQSEMVLDSNGHFNALAFQDGHLFGGLYAAGELYEMDPAKFDPVLRVRARNAGAMITRPYVLLAHPDGKRVFMGGYYDRTGEAGGGVAIYNKETGEQQLLSARQLLPGHSPMSMVALRDGRVLIGTAVGTRGRADQTAEEAMLFTLNPENPGAENPVVPAPGAESILDLVAMPDGQRVLGITNGGELFVYDTEAGSVTGRVSLGEYGSLAAAQAPRVMGIGPDGNLYVLFSRHIVQVNPYTLAHRPIGTPPEGATGSLTLLGDRLYYINHAHLWSCRLSPDSAQPSF